MLDRLASSPGLLGRVRSWCAESGEVGFWPSGLETLPCCLLWAEVVPQHLLTLTPTSKARDDGRAPGVLPFHVSPLLPPSIANSEMKCPANVFT